MSRVESPVSPRRLQQAPHCLSCHGGSLAGRVQGAVVASALAGLGQGGGTRATVQQHVSPRHGHFLGSERAALPQSPGSGHPLPRTNPSKPLLRGLVSAWGSGVSLQSKLLSRAVNLQSASHREQREHGGGTDLGDAPLGRQEETSLLAQQPSFQHASCSRQGWRAGSGSQAEKFLCIQSFYSIKFSGS